MNRIIISLVLVISAIMIFYIGKYYGWKEGIFWYIETFEKP